MVVFHMQKMHNLDKKYIFFYFKGKGRGCKKKGGGKRKERRMQHIM